MRERKRIEALGWQHAQPAESERGEESLALYDALLCPRD